MPYISFSTEGTLNNLVNQILASPLVQMHALPDLEQVGKKLLQLHQFLVGIPESIVKQLRVPGEVTTLDAVITSAKLLITIDSEIGVTQPPRSSPHCFHCNQVGHLQRDCHNYNISTVADQVIFQKIFGSREMGTGHLYRVTGIAIKALQGTQMIIVAVVKSTEDTWTVSLMACKYIH